MSHDQRGHSANAHGGVFRARGGTSAALRAPALTFRGNLWRAGVKGVLQGIKNSPKIDIIWLSLPTVNHCYYFRIYM